MGRFRSFESGARELFSIGLRRFWFKIGAPKSVPRYDLIKLYYEPDFEPWELVAAAPQRSGGVWEFRRERSCRLERRC